MSTNTSSISYAGLARSGSAHCERLSQNELLSSLPHAQSAAGQWKRWCGRGNRTYVTLIEQCTTRTERRGPHADNICADIRALQSAVSCAQNVAILVSGTLREKQL